MRASDEAVVHIYDCSQLRAHRLVFVIGRRLEGTIGQYQMTSLAERPEGVDQLRIVEFIQCGENLATVVLHVVKQCQYLRTQQSAQLVPQRVVGRFYLGDQVRHLWPFAGLRTFAGLGALACLRGLADLRERARDPLRSHDPLVEIGRHILRRLSGNRHLRRQVTGGRGR
jgi:hypothetical protein